MNLVKELYLYDACVSIRLSSSNAFVFHFLDKPQAGYAILDFDIQQLAKWLGLQFNLNPNSKGLGFDDIEIDTNDYETWTVFDMEAEETVSGLKVRVTYEEGDKELNCTETFSYRGRYTVVWK